MKKGQEEGEREEEEEEEEEVCQNSSPEATVERKSQNKQKAFPTKRLFKETQKKRRRNCDKIEVEFKEQNLRLHFPVVPIACDT